MVVDKSKVLDTALVQIEKQFGKGAVMRLGQNQAMQVKAISTGSLSLDMALGVGSLPRGRIVGMYGPESSGKTTPTLHCIAQGQKDGSYTAFIDVEHAFDPVYARALGMDVDALLVSQPDTGEQALGTIEALVRSGAIDVIVVDSVAALVPRAEIEGDTGDSRVGLQARLMSRTLRKLVGAISKSNYVTIFINQLHEKVGVIYGSPEVAPGGRTLKFYASVRIDVRKNEALKSGTEQIGLHTRAKMVKNKITSPFREAEFDVMYGQDISRGGEILDLAARSDIVQESGAWFSYGETRLDQGRDNSKGSLKDNPELIAEIEQKLRENADRLPSEASDLPKKPATPSASSETIKPVEIEQAAPPAKPATSGRASSKANIDILVDD